MIQPGDSHTEQDYSHIARNYSHVLARIAEAASKSGRLPSAVTLVAVTKTIPPGMIAALLRLGVRDIGENKAQELLAKHGALEAEFHPSWHFIGHLQRNKVRQIIDKTAMIHSLDSFPLVEEIERRAAEAGKVMDALAEVNIASEPSKYGLGPEEAADFAESLADLKHVRLRGFMCVAPDVEYPGENRIYFRKMHQLFVDTREKLRHNNHIDCLSMGMTGDYPTAIEEGATIVRIGTGIFGARNI